MYLYTFPCLRYFWQMSRESFMLIHLPKHIQYPPYVVHSINFWLLKVKWNQTFLMETQTYLEVNVNLNISEKRMHMNGIFFLKIQQCQGSGTTVGTNVLCHSVLVHHLTGYSVAHFDIQTDFVTCMQLIMNAITVFFYYYFFLDQTMLKGSFFYYYIFCLFVCSFVSS